MKIKRCREWPFLKIVDFLAIRTRIVGAEGKQQIKSICIDSNRCRLGSGATTLPTVQLASPFKIFVLSRYEYIFKTMSHPRPLFVYFRSFQTINRIKTIDFSGIQTRIVGVEGSTLDHHHCP